MKKIILLLLICFSLPTFAQTSDQYLKGAVPVIDGKVTFSKEMNVSSLNQEQIYNTLLKWAESKFKPNDKLNPRIIYTNILDGTIAISGEEYMVFASNPLSLDRTRIYYQIRIDCKPENCKATITRIHYWYNEGRDGGEKFNAEEWITDKISLNKAGTKLYANSGKFRTKTIDLKNDLFKEMQSALNDVIASLGIQQSVPFPAPTTQAKQETPKMETEVVQTERISITAGNDEQFDISKDSWGGFGELFGKEVAFCLLDKQKTMTNMLMSQSEEYHISFYPANSNQPTKVIKCKKLMTQSIEGKEAKKMNPNCELEKTYQLYIGEIIK